VNQRLPSVLAFLALGACGPVVLFAAAAHAAARLRPTARMWASAIGVLCSVATWPWVLLLPSDVPQEFYLGATFVAVSAYLLAAADRRGKIGFLTFWAAVCAMGVSLGMLPQWQLGRVGELLLLAALCLLPVGGALIAFVRSTTGESRTRAAAER
jgi:hypothetical protein